MSEMDSQVAEPGFLSQLNPDCILHLLHYLDLPNLIKITVLNGDLTGLVQYHIHRRNFDESQDLPLLHEKTIRKNFMLKRDMTKTLAYTDQELKNVGSFLETYEMSISQNEFAWQQGPFNVKTASKAFVAELLKQIQQHCGGRRLRHLKLGRMLFNVNVTPVRRLMSQLTGLTLHRVIINEWEISRLLSKCVNLEKLEIVQIKISGECLQQPMQKLKEIRVYLGRNKCIVDRQLFWKFLNANKQLTAIGFNDQILSFVRSEIHEHFHRLKCAEFNGFGNANRYRAFHIDNFDLLDQNKLQRLVLSHYIIGDAVLYHIQRFRYIKFLGMFHNEERDLKIDDIKEMLQNLEQLEIFSYFSYDMSEEKLIGVVAAGISLRELVVDIYNFEFTLELYETLVDIVDKRVWRVPLVLIIEDDRFKWTPEFVEAVDKFEHIVDLRTNCHGLEHPNYSSDVFM